jgi:CheY-like chemotaxis protein
MENVLVVDDEAGILKLISENLLIRGYAVHEAQTGAGALELLSEVNPSLLVLDIKLPDLTGWELLEQIRNDPKIRPDLPVVIMTASITDANMDLHDYPNVVEVLIKPFSSSTLISVIKQSLQAY